MENNYGVSKSAFGWINPGTRNAPNHTAKADGLPARSSLVSSDSPLTPNNGGTGEETDVPPRPTLEDVWAACVDHAREQGWGEIEDGEASHQARPRRSKFLPKVHRPKRRPKG